MALYHLDNVIVEAICLGMYIVISFFSVVLVLGRKSYQSLLCCCRRSNHAKATAAASTEAARTHKRLLDAVILSMASFLIYRVASSAVRLAAHIVQTPTSNLAQEPLEQAATILMIIGYPLYTLIFSLLLWLWLKLGLVFFEGSKRQQSCIEWTVRAILFVAGVSMLILMAVILVFQVYPTWKYGSYRAAYLTVAEVVAILFLVDLVIITVLSIVLGVRISLLICKTIGKEAALAQQRNTLTKLGVAVAIFVVAMNMRVVGVASVFLTSSYWIMSLFLMALPELLCFGVLIFVLWPFSIVCCSKRIMAPDRMEVSKQAKALEMGDKKLVVLESRVSSLSSDVSLSAAGSPSAGSPVHEQVVLIRPIVDSVEGSSSAPTTPNPSDISPPSVPTMIEVSSPTTQV